MKTTEMALGIAMFVSVGNKGDVSGNDLLEYWEHDESTHVALLYLESFGNPRRFGRLARRMARHKPIVAVKAGRTAAGARAASSHTGSIVGLDIATESLGIGSGEAARDVIILEGKERRHLGTGLEKLGIE